MRALVTGRRARREGGGKGEEEEEDDDKGTRCAKLSVLLQVATKCRSLLNAVSEDVLKIGGLQLEGRGCGLIVMCDFQLLPMV